ncbi:hypothetical protein KSP40_PGU019018 [Platanthera guangdongensis]|uniref:Uncharacterized protein n=1 Tax=Platanthera guangdongensis TaxID=2320717 RepID=A0ABR2M021_9ASPA
MFELALTSLLRRVPCPPLQIDEALKPRRRPFAATTTAFRRDDEDLSSCSRFSLLLLSPTSSRSPSPPALLSSPARSAALLSRSTTLSPACPSRPPLICSRSGLLLLFLIRGVWIEFLHLVHNQVYFKKFFTY